MRPHRWRPTRLPHPWDSPGKNTGVGCHFLLQCMKGKSESEFAQSCPTLCDPMVCSLPGSSVHGIFQARVLEWGAIAFSNAWKWKVKVKSLSRVWPSATPWTAAHQAPLSMGFSRQEYWSGVPLPSPIAALFNIAKQPKCPLTDEWIKTMSCMCIYTHSHQYYSVLKKNQTDIYTTWMDLEISTLSEYKKFKCKITLKERRLFLLI